MPVQPNLEALFEKHLGKEAAARIIGRIDKMARAKATPAQIEKATVEEIATHLQTAVVNTVLAKVGPITPIKVKPLSSSIKTTIGPIVVSPKITSGVQIKVGPAMEVRV